MFINKEGKLFGKISIIDIFIVIVILAVGFAGYTRFFKTEETKVATESQQIEYTILIRGVRGGTVDGLRQLGPITNFNTKEYAGELVEVVEVVDATETKTLTNGTAKAVTLPEKFDVTVRVRIDGSVNNSGYFTPTNQSINTGSTLFFTSKYVNTSGVISSVYKVD